MAYVDEHGHRIEPAFANAVKFEQFIFDTLPLARRSLVFETDRAAEFEPLKNASGDASPETVRQRLSDAGADLLERAGAVVRAASRRLGGGADRDQPAASPPTAEALARRVPPGTVVDGPFALS